MLSKRIKERGLELAKSYKIDCLKFEEKRRNK